MRAGVFGYQCGILAGDCRGVLFVCRRLLLVDPLFGSDLDGLLFVRLRLLRNRGTGGVRSCEQYPWLSKKFFS